MSVEEIMKDHGFRISASCAGQAWYTKFIDYNGRRAYITVMDEKGEGLPQLLDDPVVVVVYDLRSGDELETYSEVDFLRSYLESLGDFRFETADRRFWTDAYCLKLSILNPPYGI